MPVVRIAVLCVLLLGLRAPLLCGEERPGPPQDEPKSIWQENAPKETQAHSEAFAARFLSIQRAKNPERARALRRMYEENPDRFWEEVLKEFQQPKAPVDPTVSPDTEEDSPSSRLRAWEERMQKRHEEFIAWLEKNDPELAVELAVLKKEDPETYLGKVYSARKRYEPILKAEEDNPELADVLKKDLQLQKQRDQILRKIQTASGKEKERLTQELRRLVSERFDLIVLKKELMYGDLEKRLRRLEEELSKRQQELSDLKAGKEQNVKQRMDELLNEGEKINWN